MRSVSPPAPLSPLLMPATNRRDPLRPSATITASGTGSTPTHSTLCGSSKTSALRSAAPQPQLRSVSSSTPASRPSASADPHAPLCSLSQSRRSEGAHRCCCGPPQGSEVDERAPEEQAASIAGEVRRLMHGRPATVHGFLLDCAVELGHKVPTYAMLIGACSQPRLPTSGWLAVEIGRKSVPLGVLRHHWCHVQAL